MTTRLHKMAFLTLLSVLPSVSRAYLTSIRPDAIATLRNKGFVVLPDFVNADYVAALKEDVALLRRSGSFSVAGVGEASTKRVDGTVRKCEQCFIYPRIKHSGGGCVLPFKQTFFQPSSAQTSTVRSHFGNPSRKSISVPY